jgi:hypothetical protein
MNLRQRIPLYEHNPVHAGSYYLQVVVTRQILTDPYEHEGQQRFVKYLVTGVVGAVEQAQPFRTSENSRRVAHRDVFNTLEEAEKRGDEIEAEYASRGWHHYDFVYTDF